MLFWVVGLLAAGVLMALLLPVRIDLDVDLGAEAAGPAIRTHVRWLWFAWNVSPAARPIAPPVHEAHRPVGPRRTRPTGALAALRTPGFLIRCAQLVRELRRALTPRRVAVRARVGLDDPSETGVLAGLLAAGAGWRRQRAFDVEITPDFVDATLAVQAHLAWSIRPVLVLGPILAFVTAPVFWRALRAARRARRA